MKKVLVVMLLAIGLYSCSKDDDTIFDQSPDERLNKKLEEYQSSLSGAPNGWKGIIITDSTVAGAYQGVYHFFFRFDNSNRVKMYSDWDSTSAVTPKESSYRLKALQQPSLLFDTYSYLHLLSDPDASVNGGVNGEGLNADFEFAIDTAYADTLKLIGRFHGTKVTLVKATQQEADNYFNKKYSERLINNLGKYLTYFKRLTVGSKIYDVAVNPVARTITFTWVDSNGNMKRFTTGFYYTVNGIAFAKPFTDGNQVINGFSNMTWDAATTTLSFSVNSENATIKETNQPLYVDKTAPGRWWQTAVNYGAYWYSPLGFHVNGKNDAFGISSVTASGGFPYYYLIYFPGYQSPFDLLAPVFVNTTLN